MQLTSPLLYPTPYSKDFLNSTNRILLSSAAQYIGECFVVPKSGTVTKVGFLSSDGAGLTGSVSVGLYTTDSNGVPTSTAYDMEPGKRYFFEQFSDFKSWAENGKRYAFVPHSAIYCEIPEREADVCLAPSEVASNLESVLR